MFTIHTQYQRGYHWIQTGNIHFIGYLNSPAYHIPDTDEIANIFAKCNNLTTFKKCLSTLNGVYSVIIHNPNQLLIASDTTRYFPVFYTQNGNNWMISDSIQHLKIQKQNNFINHRTSLEFLSAGFTLGNNTLYKEIQQVQAGSVVSIAQDEVRSEFFYSFAKTAEECIERSYEKQQEKLITLLDNTFERSITPLKEQKIVLPLSGGYDSRIIACKLKELGCKNVVCFTYGRNNREVQISKDVARKLKFDWHFIEYTSDITNNITRKYNFYSYAEYAARGTSMFYLQEFPAVAELIKKGIITSDAYVLPGHSGDLLRGSLLIKSFPTNCSLEQLPNLLLRTRFQHLNLTRKEKKQLLTTLSETIHLQYYHPNLLPYSILEDWEMKERTAKYIFNSSHIFDFFGLKTVFPLWDLDLLNYFKYLPANLRAYGDLYMNTLEKHYFNTYNLNLGQDFQPSHRDIIVSAIKSKIRPYLPKFVKQKLLLKNDQFSYYPMTQILKEEMRSAMYPYIENENSLLHGILYWYLFKLERELRN